MRWIVAILAVALLAQLGIFDGSIQCLSWSCGECIVNTDDYNDTVRGKWTFNFNFTGDDVTGSELTVYGTKGGKTFYNAIMGIDTYFEWCWKGLENVTLAENFNRIEENTFAELQHLYKVTAPGVQWVDGEAFAKSTVEILELPKLESAGTGAFKMCSNLKAISFVNQGSFQSLGSGCFEGTGVMDVTLPNKETIAFGGLENLFKDCVLLENFTCAKQGIFLAKGTFSGCYNLQALKEVTILQVGDSAFYACGNLQTFNLVAATYTGDDKKMKFGVSSFEKTGIKGTFDFTGYTMDDISGAIYAFCDCPFLESIKFPSTVTNTIPEGLVKDCVALTAFEWGTGVCKIEPFAFSGCVLLKPVEHLKWGETLELGKQCFMGCALETINFQKVTGEVKLYEGVFSGCVNLTKVTYQDAKELTGFEAEIFKDCVKLQTLEYNKEKEKVSLVKDRAFYGCALFNPPFDIVETQDSSSGNWSAWLGVSAFEGCAVEKIDFSDLPNTVPNASCFRNCVHLTEVVLYNGTTKLANYLFAGCTALTEIVIPPSVTTFGNGVFADCKSLKKITYLGQAVPPGDVFDGCDNIDVVVVDEETQGCYFGGAVTSKCSWVTRNPGPFAGIMIAVILVVGAVIAVLVLLGIKGKLRCGKDKD